MQPVKVAGVGVPAQFLGKLFMHIRGRVKKTLKVEHSAVVVQMYYRNFAKLAQFAIVVYLDGDWNFSSAPQFVTH